SFDDPSPTATYTLSLHDALPIFGRDGQIEDAHAARVGNRVRDRRRDGADASFADGLSVERSRPHRILQDHGGERRNVLNGRKLEVAEAERADPSVLGLHLLHEREAEPLDEPALDLALVADG